MKSEMGSNFFALERQLIFWFGEGWTLIQLMGGAIVIAGIYMADKAREKAKK